MLFERNSLPPVVQLSMVFLFLIYLKHNSWHYEDEETRPQYGQSDGTNQSLEILWPIWFSENNCGAFEHFSFHSMMQVFEKKINCVSLATTEAFCIPDLSFVRTLPLLNSGLQTT